jgi:hypothetical protein
MATVVAARDAYKAAREEVTRTRLALGRAILEAREQGTEQWEIAGKLKLTREQVRRYQDEYEKSIGRKPAGARRPPRS